MGTEGHKIPIAARLLTIRKGEYAPVVLSALSFFLLLYGYFLLRPLREALGVERSMNDLRWLFVVTCVVSLVVSVSFGSVVSRARPARFIGIGYRIVIGCLALFAIALMTLPEDAKLYSGYVFFVWLSVVNLFMVSVFWGLMADTWTLDQGKRLYASIGVGGTLGALLGSLTAWQLADLIGPIVQIIVAALCFEIAARVMGALSTRDDSPDHPSARAQPVGGKWTEGFTAICSSPYLLGVGLYIVFIAVSSTLIYFTQANIVQDAADELEERVALFAQLDMWTQLATLFVQLFITSRMIRALGISITLMVLPVVTIVGFVALAWAQESAGAEPWVVWAILATFGAVHRASRYAVIRPARETLFSVVSREQKYKSKPVIDVFLYRGGDVAGVGVESALTGLALGLWGIVAFSAPLVAMWGILCAGLALAQTRKSKLIDSPKPDTPSTGTPSVTTGVQP